MKIHYKMLFVILIGCNLSYSISIEKQIKMKELELETIRKYVENARDSLEEEIVNRFSHKQQLMEQREADKEEMEKIREKQELLNSELAHYREEVLSYDQNLVDLKKTTLQLKSDWDATNTSLSEIFEKERITISETYPLKLIERQKEFEKVRSTFYVNRSLHATLLLFVKYKIHSINDGSTISLKKDKILLNDGSPIDATVISFGNVMGYGMDSESNCYIIRQTGFLGKEKYSVNKIEAPDIVTYLQTTFPKWVQNKQVEGDVLLDLLQNEQSRMILSGKKESFIDSTYHSIKMGGAIMIPLLLLPLWVIYLLAKKVIQIYGRKKKFTVQYKKVMRLLDEKKYDEALVYLKKSKGSLAKVLETCIELRAGHRDTCERIVREIIYHEIPIINRGINTMAVIAGAAPLIGLLGTISGMITLFSAVTHFGTGDPKFLAGGISEALITAKTGLAIAIPALFFHDFLRNSKESFVAQVDESTTHLLNYLWPEG